jgi:hypothetical protein
MVNANAIDSPRQTWALLSGCTGNHFILSTYEKRMQKRCSVYEAVPPTHALVALHLSVSLLDFQSSQTPCHWTACSFELSSMRPMLVSPTIFRQTITNQPWYRALQSFPRQFMEFYSTTWKLSSLKICCLFWCDPSIFLEQSDSILEPIISHTLVKVTFMINTIIFTLIMYDFLWAASSSSLPRSASLYSYLCQFFFLQDLK